jgi:hypothetical protein
MARSDDRDGAAVLGEQFASDEEKGRAIVDLAEIDGVGLVENGQESQAGSLPSLDLLDVPFDLIPSDVIEEIGGRVPHVIQGSLPPDDRDRAPSLLDQRRSPVPLLTAVGYQRKQCALLERVDHGHTP